MIEISIAGFTLFLLHVTACSLSGFYLSSLLPWNDAARSSGLDRATGLSLGPFVSGLSAVIALGVFRTQSHETHLIVSFTVICAVTAVALFFRSKKAKDCGYAMFNSTKWSHHELAILAAILMAVFALLFISIFSPLTQNDALEYALVARELYATRDLLSYPILNSQTNVTGFYGPWTHPPLYVAQLYLAEVMQGTADNIGLIRLISPWFCISGAYLSYTLGNMIGRLTGLIACLLFLSPPLFFLGAASALIDPLSVLGFALVVSLLIGLNAKPSTYGTLVGVALGLSLWTHSQAILFIPLTLVAIAITYGLRNWRHLVKASIAATIVATFISCWPYWHNIQIFGSLISDNPTVFALPELHWDDYFFINRGLSSPMAMLQFGVFKGWFAVESYGLVFWGMAAGLIIFFSKQKISFLFEVLTKGFTTLKREERLLFLMAFLFFVYMAGVVVSVLLGIDHMVKNERYLLINLPFVSVFCAYGYLEVSKYAFKKTAKLYIFSIYILAISMIAQTSFFTAYILISNRGFKPTFTAPLMDKLWSIPQYSIINHINKDTNSTKPNLTMRPSDMYYSKQRMVSYLDPQTLPLYQATSVEAAIQWLRDENIRYIHVPDYGIPPLYNSLLYKVIQNHDLTTLVSDSNEGQIYELKKADLALVSTSSLIHNSEDWTSSKFFSLGGRKGFGNIELTHGPFAGPVSEGGLPYDLFHRNIITAVTIFSEDYPTGAEPNLEYSLDIAMKGTGLVRVFANFDTFNEHLNKTSNRSRRLVTFELSEKQPERKYGLRFSNMQSSRKLSISVEHVGKSRIEITDATLTIYRRKNP